MSGEKKKKKTIITVPTATVKVNEKYGKKMDKQTNKTNHKKENKMWVSRDFERFRFWYSNSVQVCGCVHDLA